MPSKNWSKRLFKEIELWLEEKIIEPYQADTIKNRYSESIEHNRLLASLFILGSILISIGIIFFVASNWQYIGEAFKISIIFFLIAGFNLAGYYLRFRRNNYPRLGESLIFLGAVCFGAGIWLIAQIFQIPYNYANGILFWFIGILPLIYVSRSNSVLVLASLLLPVWLSVYIANNLESPAYHFFLLLAILIYLIYRQKQKISLFIAILGFGIWLAHYLFVKLIAWNTSSLNKFILYTNLFISFGFLLYCLGIMHNHSRYFSGFSNVYKIWGMISIFVTNYLFTFEPFYTSLLDSKKPIQLISLFLPGLFIYVLYFVSIFTSLIYILKFKDEEKIKEIGIILFFLVLQIIFMHFWQFDIVIVLAGYTALLFMEIIAFLYVGYFLCDETIFRFSLFSFALYILAKYIDTFWNTLPRSIFFTFGGIILILGGIYLDKKRKSLEKKMQKKLKND